mmetsp:Transcript_25229/g.39371  ORF Transcript_25229/g.39371 Transcript_25229/m.39371 type:complete len:270 (-) Transcript_25229:11-820(-)
MNDIILYGPRVPTSVLLRESFSTHVKLSRMTFSLFLPALIDLEKQIRKWDECHESPKNVFDVIGEIFHLLKRKSKKWLSGVISCCLHTTAALCLSKIDNATCQRTVFLYRLHPKLSPFYVQKLIKWVLPEKLSIKMFKKMILDEDQVQYMMNLPDFRFNVRGIRLRDSILRRGVYACADFAVHLMLQRIPFNLWEDVPSEKELRHFVNPQSVKYAIVYHGGALCAGSIGGFLGYSYASNEGEYWGELLASILWMKWINKFNYEFNSRCE